MQLDHQSNKFENRSFPIILVCDHIRGAANVGALFRIADAFGIEKIIFCGTVPEFSRRMQKTSRSAEKNIPFEFEELTTDTLRNLKAKGYNSFAVEITDSSIAIDNFEFGRIKSTVLVLGGESHGISEEVLKLCDQALHISMFGHNSSMNVAQACSIALFEITRQWNSI